MTASEFESGGEHNGVFWVVTSNFNQRLGNDGTAQATSAGGVLGDPRVDAPLWRKQRGRKQFPNSHLFLAENEKSGRFPKYTAPQNLLPLNISLRSTGGLWSGRGCWGAGDGQPPPSPM